VGVTTGTGKKERHKEGRTRSEKRPARRSWPQRGGVEGYREKKSEVTGKKRVFGRAKLTGGVLKTGKPRVDKKTNQSPQRNGCHAGDECGKERVPGNKNRREEKKTKKGAAAHVGKRGGHWASGAR